MAKMTDKERRMDAVAKVADSAARAQRLAEGLRADMADDMTTLTSTAKHLEGIMASLLDALAEAALAKRGL